MWFGNKLISDFPEDLYNEADIRTKSYVYKWAMILSAFSDLSGTNNLLMNLEVWNREHPEYKTSLRSIYRNKCRLEKFGWTAFFSLEKRNQQTNKNEPPLSSDEIRDLRNLLRKFKGDATPSQATA